MPDKIKIMIAEDFEIIREDFCETINSQVDMEIIGSVSTGHGIVELVSEKIPDIVLLDIEMEHPRAGIEAAEKINKINQLIKIIFLTVHENDEIIFSAMATGAADYIVKSVEPYELLNHIRNVYQGTPRLSDTIEGKIHTEFARLKRTETSLLYFVSKLPDLTSTERELIRLLLLNKKVVEIAKIRSVQLVTVKTQINSLLKKFNCHRTRESVDLIHKLRVENLFLQ